MHKDPDADLVLRMKANATFADYVQMHGCTPRRTLHVVMFNKSQIELLRKLRKVNGGYVIAHVDATGGVIRRQHKSDPETLLHGVVISSPVSDRSPIAVCEFLSPKRDKHAIAGCLTRFVQE